LATRYAPGLRREFAFAIGKSTGNAVRRNRLRRRLRAVVASHHDLFPPGAYLISAHPATSAMSTTELRTAVVGLAAAVNPAAVNPDAANPAAVNQETA